MGSYYYLDDSDSDMGSFPLPEEEFFKAYDAIIRRQGLEMTDQMIVDEYMGKTKKSKGKTNFYIDGTNLFAGQHELFGPNKHLSFDFLIQEIKKLILLNDTFFYASYMNQKNRTSLTDDRKKLISAEALFYREVRSSKGVTFYRGHRSPTSGKEKGVDVHLSVDIVKDVFLGRCNKVVIMTGDADLIYPLEVVKILKIPTIAIFLPNRFSLEIAYKADKAFVLNFLNKFKQERKLPKSLKVVSIKKPRMINIRGK